MSTWPQDLPQASIRLGRVTWLRAREPALIPTRGTWDGPARPDTACRWAPQTGPWMRGGGLPRGQAPSWKG